MADLSRCCTASLSERQVNLGGATVWQCGACGMDYATRADALLPAVAITAAPVISAPPTLSRAAQAASQALLARAAEPPSSKE